MNQRLVLQDKEGQIIRSMVWENDQAVLIRRLDTKRIQLVEDLTHLKRGKFQSKKLRTFRSMRLKSLPI